MTTSNFIKNNSNLLYNKSDDLTRYNWNSLFNTKDGPKSLSFCEENDLGNKADINDFTKKNPEDIENTGCIAVPGNPFYAPIPTTTPEKPSRWTAEIAQRSMPWLLGPTETIQIKGTTVKSFLSDTVQGICSGTSSFVNDIKCNVGIMDGTGNTSTSKDWDVKYCGKQFKREDNIKKSYGEGVINRVSEIGKGQVKPLLLGGDEDTKKGGEILFVKNNQGYIPKEIIAVNKTWGQVQPNVPSIDEIESAPNGKLGIHGKEGGWFNGGILASNINISKKPITVKRKVKNIRGDLITKQHVIELSARGDFYDSTKNNVNTDEPIEGIYKNFTKQDCGTTCSPYLKRDPSKNNNAIGKIHGYDENKNPKYLDVGARTGSCIVTRDLYGPGYYEATLWLPKTLNKDGRGYVFAMWMFQYSEAYSAKGKTDTFPYNFLPSCEGCTKKDGPKIPCWSEGDNSASAWCPLIGGTCAPWDDDILAPTRKVWCDDTLQGKKCCEKKVGIKNCAHCETSAGKVTGPQATADVVTTWGHEIDIEIPSNAGVGQKAEGGNKNGWDTFNCNPWWGDMEEWEKKYSAVPYTSEVSQSKDGTDFTSTDGNWHTIGFEWITPNMNEGPGILTWFYDGVPIHRTTRFVPNRVGRMVIGPWPASWGASDGIWMPFENITVLLADLTILPYTDSKHAGGASAWPQSQDQPGLMMSEGKPVIGCDFKDFTETERSKNQSNKRLGPNTPPNYINQIEPSKKSNIIMWVLLVVIFCIMIGVVVFFLKKK
tara:strand:- start:3387 stop:5687 length:2301 start_codon:yes stop_codon:yes gene_type:complete